MGLWLFIITALLVAVGCWLWLFDHVGWGQLFLVMASGTAGGAVVVLLEDRRR